MAGLSAVAELERLQERVYLQSAVIERVRAEVHRVIVGQEAFVDRLLIALFANGHLLVEGVPGLAKTLAIRTLAKTLNATFSRIQFTPDLLPADITGTLVYNHQKGEFTTRKGPIFAHFVLADEINRAPPKVQSALLEAMQERQVTIGDNTHRLPEPFVVMATQNPLEQEGTYPLPEAQLDRFLMKVHISYPAIEEERQIVRLNLAEKLPETQQVCSVEEVLSLRSLIYQLYMDEKVEDYILQIVSATRIPEKYGLERLKPYIRFGASPRGSIALAVCARALALLNRRAYVTPDDVRVLAHDVLRHRIGITYEGQAEGIQPDTVISEILATIEVP